MKSCSANSPSCLQRRDDLGHARADGHGLQRDDVELAAVLRAVEVGQADAVVAGLAREDEPLEHGLAIVGVEHDDLVALAVAGEVAQPRARAQVVLLAPHALQARLEVLVDELAPRLALHAAPAPVQLEQDVRVEVREDVVERHVDLARAPERRLGDRHVGARGRAHGVVVGDRAAAGPCRAGGSAARRARIFVDELRAPVGVDELVHLVAAPRTRPCSRRRPARRCRRPRAPSGTARAGRSRG